jgi:hypothetical protein
LRRPYGGGRPARIGSDCPDSEVICPDFGVPGSRVICPANGRLELNVRVVGVGFGRTGTASLKLAIERLGFGPCYHMFNVVDDPRRAGDWLAIANGAQPDWDGVFAGFNSTVDWPAAAFWRELVDAYPDALVVLTVRDPQRWYDSAEQTIFRAFSFSHSPLGRQLLRLIALTDPGFRSFAAMTDAVVRQRVFDGRTGDRPSAIGVFERHSAQVQATVPPERLLTFDVAQGWQPLCDFLGVPVPDEPFPHINDAAEFNRRRAARMRRTLVPAAAIAGLGIGVAVTGTLVARSLYRSRRGG